ncbi:MAG: hypothetical protein K6B72_12905 [Lachnospiraceae bacterium]|nr:hypothetical protein [Lachnospiraceae bacterium]
MKKMKKMLLALFLVLTMLAAACACGDDAGKGSDRSSKKHAQKDDEDEEDEEDEEEEEEKEEDEEDEKEDGTETEDPEQQEPDENDSKNAVKTESPAGLGIYLQKKVDDQWSESMRQLLISYSYDRIGLTDDTAAAWPELDKKLMVVNDLIATEEGNMFMKDSVAVGKMSDIEIQKEAEAEGGSIPLTNKWTIDVMRADEELLSFLVKRTDTRGEYIVSYYDAYNIIPETGEDLALSDVLADPDAVFSIVAEKLRYLYSDFMSGPDGGDEETILKDYADLVKKDLAEGQCASWALGPEGITFAFDAMTFAPFDAVVSIAFSEDKDGSLFADKWRYPAGEDWVIQLPLYDKVEFDGNDNGETDWIVVQEEFDPEITEYDYLTGLRVYYNSEDAAVLELGEEMGIQELYLAHRGGKTFLMVGYSEYDWDFIEIYSLEKGKIEQTQLLSGWFWFWDNGSMEPDEYYARRMLVTDLSNIRITTMSELLSMIYCDMTYDLSGDGRLVPKEPVVQISEDQQYELTLEQPIIGVPVVSEKTLRETNETVDLKKGDVLKFMDTDLETFVDFTLEDGSIVRIYVFYEEDFGRYILSAGKKLLTYDTFEGMFYAG